MARSRLRLNSRIRKRYARLRELLGDLIERLEEIIESLKESISLAESEGIYRRYVVMGFFDGCLTVFGFVLGSYLGGVEDPRVIFMAGLSGGIALGISNAWGTLEAERIEAERELRDLEHHVLNSVRGSRLERAYRISAIFNSIIHGLSPFVAAIIPVLPFYLASERIIEIGWAFETSIALTLALLFLLGILVEKSTLRNGLKNGLRFMFVGLIAGVILFLLGGGKV